MRSQLKTPREVAGSERKLQQEEIHKRWRRQPCKHAPFLEGKTWMRFSTSAFGKSGLNEGRLNNQHKTSRVTSEIGTRRQ